MMGGFPIAPHTPFGCILFEQKLLVTEMMGALLQKLWAGEMKE